MTQLFSNLHARVPSWLKRSTLQKHTQKNRIKKRHWCLGSVVIFVGSWITHTTTATIADASVQPELLGLANITEVSAYQENDARLISTLVSSPPVLPMISKPVAEEQFETLEHTVKRGESLGTIFRKHGMDIAIPHYISQHKVAKQLVSLSVGKTLAFKFDEHKQLRRIIYPSSPLQELIVDLKDDQIMNAEFSDLAYILKDRNVSGDIQSSLYEAALDAGLSNAMVMEMVEIFGWDIDFVLDIRRGDTFHVIHNEYTLDGETLADGHILAAEFTTQGRTHRAIRYQDPEGVTSYYTPEGDSMLGTFLRSPVKFSRISSRFGKRRHPISKKWKAHKGVDYAASRGTPIRSTANGKIVHVGNKGGYGKTVILRHAGRFSTLYAHMNGFAKGIRTGSRVEQGQTIGYVGSTGYSTGPHLHYEFRVDGVHRNSLTYKTPKASSIKDEFKTEFLAQANSWTRTLDAVQQDYLVAKSAVSGSTQSNSL